MLNLKVFSCMAVIAAALLHPSIALSQAYKCVDASGKTTFSDQGCVADHSAAKVDIGSVNTQDSSQYQQRILDERLEPKQKMRVTVMGNYCKAALTKHKGAHGLTAAQLSAASACVGRGGFSVQ